MGPTRVSALTAIAVAVGVLTWIVLRFTYSAIPPLSWTAVPTLLLLALGELSVAQNLRPRIRRRPGTRPVDPLVVARMVALAKASAYVAAVIVGGCAGFVARVAGSFEKATPRHDLFVSGGTLLAAVVLAAAALYLEWCCRVPKGPDDEGRGGRFGR